MAIKPTSGNNFESIIEAQLVASGFHAVDPFGFNCDRAVFPDVVFGFIRETQSKKWAKLDGLRGHGADDSLVEGTACRPHRRCRYQKNRRA